MSKSSSKVEKRNETFVERAASRIWQEVPTSDNPYITATARCHGYDLMELVKKRSYVDVLYLLFRGELPNNEEAELLEQLMIGLINPGPRHPATRAAMNAGVGKTDPAHILPIAITVYGGEHLGAGAIEPAMRFFRQNRNLDPQQVANTLLSSSHPPNVGDWHIAPGFGSRFGGIDILSWQLASQLAKLNGAGKSLAWGCRLAEALAQHTQGWLSTGVAAAVFTDLGFNPRAGTGLFQIMAAPGLLAHGIELSNKPITAMPFITEENYVIEY